MRSYGRKAVPCQKAHPLQHQDHLTRKSTPMDWRLQMSETEDEANH